MSKQHRCDACDGPATVARGVKCIGAVGEVTRRVWFWRHSDREVFELCADCWDAWKVERKRLLKRREERR